MYQAKALCEDKISSMGAEEWLVKCKHVEKIERDYAAAEPQIDNIIESLIISVGSDTDSSDSDPEEEDNLSGIEKTVIRSRGGCAVDRRADNVTRTDRPALDKAL
ncbi:hypothetical protein J6590_054084 [Homalodisca vitripennis]|nr:hypothetical protein J6590_054084 [Homalodisca vitripennis]